jgi:hypothetical protein
LEARVKRLVLYGCWIWISNVYNRYVSSCLLKRALITLIHTRLRYTMCGDFFVLLYAPCVPPACPYNGALTNRARYH